MSGAFPSPLPFPRARKLTELTSTTIWRRDASQLSVPARVSSTSIDRAYYYIWTRVHGFIPTPRSPASPPAGLFQDLREGARLPTFAQDAPQREGVAGVQGLGCRLWRGLFRCSFFRVAVFFPEDAVVIRGVSRVASAPAIVVRLERDV